MHMYRATDISGLARTVKDFQAKLKSNELVIVETLDHNEHVAAYTAWLEQPGRILVCSPLLPVEQRSYLKELALTYQDHRDVIMFHTSGTTGMPKLILHDRRSMSKIKDMSQSVFGWDRDYVYVNVIPAMTSAFWHIILPNFVEKQFQILASTRESIKHDLPKGGPVCLLVPNVLDMLMSTKTSLDLSNYEKILAGGSRVRACHAEYVLANGAKMFDHSFGSTETGSPLLSREMSDSSRGDYTRLTAVSGMETQLVDGELWVRGDSICTNFRDFNHHDDWYRTGDYWENGPDDLIKFLGRKDDFVKMNGYRANLNDIEHWFEQQGLGECLAVPSRKLGVDWIELWYTGPGIEDQTHLVKQCQEVMVPCCVPRKFKKVSQLPKTSLGKKQRVNNADQ